MNKSKLLDERIVRLLSTDGRLTGEQIADELNISSATVRRRINKLIEKKLLHFSVVVDPGNFGFPQAATIGLKISPDKTQSVVKYLSDIQEIRWLASTTGRFNLIAGMRYRSLSDLSDFITGVVPNIEGIQDSETFVHLKGVKRGPNLLLT